MSPDTAIFILGNIISFSSLFQASSVTQTKLTLKSDPAILFLDEPTSGLDSFQALSVMQSMKELARNGRLVISVIHQPRSSIFDMFDRLLLLSQVYSDNNSDDFNYEIIK
jgi:ABC-type multidrug transport system ATPase subunit